MTEGMLDAARREVAGDEGRGVDREPPFRATVLSHILCEILGAAWRRKPPGVGGDVENRVRKVIDEGGLAIGGLTGSFTDPTIVELIALAGCDAALIDLEHHPFDLHDVQGLVVAARSVGITSIVRIPSLDPPLILRLLDLGTQCIQLDGIQTADEARALVDAMKFPPLGSRGLIWNSRAANYGRVDKATYADDANREVLVKVSIDSQDGLNNVEDIAAVQGVDIIGVGAHDLSMVLDVVGQPDHPKLVAAIDRVIGAVTRNGGRRLALPLGSSAYPRTPAELVERGAVYTNLSPHPEERLLRSLAQQAEGVRSAIAGAQA
jgi:2-keto-3-deoxy-L-rhamnonate aldolase RhmA